MRAVADALRSLGRACFRWADAIGPDAVTRAFDQLYQDEEERASRWAVGIVDPGPVRWPPHDPRSVALEMQADGLIAPTQCDRMIGRESYIPPRRLERVK